MPAASPSRLATIGRSQIDGHFSRCDWVQSWSVDDEPSSRHQTTRYSPFQLGLRFSANARGPSIKSWEANNFFIAGNVILLASSSDMCRP